MHGVYVNGYRPKTKKALKEAIAELNARSTHPSKNTDDTSNDHDPSPKMPLVRLQATSIYGNEFDGTLEEALADNQYGVFYLVGPDPYTNRRWYANLRYNAETGRWTVQ